MKNNMKIRTIINEINESPDYLFHGTSVGATLSIQRDGYIKPFATGESKKSISFSGDMKWAMYYAKAKGGTDRQVILRIKNSDKFTLSDRIAKNKNAEFITFDPIPIRDLEIKTKSGWLPLENWDYYEDGN